MVSVSALWCLSQHLPSYLGFSYLGRGSNRGVIEAIKPKDNPYQKRVVDNPFHHMEKLMKEILCKNPISLIWVLGVACHSALSYQELIRNRGLKRDRKQHTGIQLLNIPWQPLTLPIIMTAGRLWEIGFEPRAETHGRGRSDSRSGGWFHHEEVMVFK